MRYIYVLLTRSRTAFSRLIHVLTGDEFTHASLGLGYGAVELYSFSRKRVRVPLPSSIMREDAEGTYMSRRPNMPCALYRLEVDEDCYERIRRRVEEMYSEQSSYHYSLLGTALCNFDIAHERSRHYFCSQFVADVLAGAGAIELPKSASLMRPADFERLPELEKVYSGPILFAPGAEYMYMKGAANGRQGEVRAI